MVPLSGALAYAGDIETPSEGGYHWLSAEHASEWLRTLNQRGPERAEAFQHMLALLPFSQDAELSFLDLGAGAGALAAVLLERYTRSHAVLADFSETMMAEGRKSLARFHDRFRYVVYDMNDPEWPAELAGPFQAAVSSQAIHHLPNPRKAALFRQVHDRLTSGGVFANWDPLRDPQLHSHPEDHHSKTLATLDEMLDLLRQAGFADLACTFQTADSALVSGRKGP